MIVKRPIITEKSKYLADKQNKYIFEVDRRSKKGAIAKEIEEKFGVEVLNVATISLKGKVKRQLGKRKTYKRPDIKKAVVTLKEGDSIDLFEKKK